MSTSAAVFVESLQKTVRVNSDGYPENMMPALERLVKEELLDSFASHDEYVFIVSKADDYSRLLGTMADRSVAVDEVGFAFPEDDAIEVKAAGYNGVYTFTNDEDHEYVIKVDGSIIEWFKEGN